MVCMDTILWIGQKHVFGRTELILKCFVFQREIRMQNTVYNKKKNVKNTRRFRVGVDQTQRA